MSNNRLQATASSLRSCVTAASRRGSPRAGGFSSTGENMAFWWVNHKQTHKEEIEGGYLWSPKCNKNGGRNETYLNLTRAGVADIVFSYALGAIRVVCDGEAAHRECDRPSAFGKTGEQWDKDGWLVSIDWSMLQTPIAPQHHLDAISPLLP